MADQRTGPTNFDGFLEEAFPLIAEDLRAARIGLGLTSAVAAERAELSLTLYRALEHGSVARTTGNLGLMMSASRCLGMETVRFSYVNEVQQYMKVDLSADGPLIVFIDTWRLDIRDLKEQSAFVSPYHVLALVERIGFYETFASRQLADKLLIEMWIAAVFTLSLGSGRDYYLGLISDNAPDVEVLVVNGTDRRFSGIRVEITRHGSHSKDLIDVIRKKLRKKYQEGTVIVVLVEQAEDILINELDGFIRTNNPYDQRIFVIGGSTEPGSFKVVPWDEVTRSTTAEISWLEMGVDAENASKGYRGYEGVVLKPPGRGFLPPHPTFVKKLELHR